MKTKRLLFVVLATCMVLLAAFRFWKGHQQEYEAKLQRPFALTALSIDGHLYDSTKSSTRALQLLVFCPNEITRENMQRLKNFYADFMREWGNEIEPILVSRINAELLHNLRGITAWKGTILMDPSGAAGQIFGFWQQLNQDDGWHIVLLEGQTRQNAGEWNFTQMPAYADFKKYLKP